MVFGFIQENRVYVTWKALDIKMIGLKMEIILSANIDSVSWEELARVFGLAPLGKKRDPEKLQVAFRSIMFGLKDLKTIFQGLGGC